MATRTGPSRTIPDYYRQFVRVGPPPPAVEAWQGVSRPFARCGSDELLLILDGLRVGAQVLVGGGYLRHDPKCPRTHEAVSYAREVGDARTESFAIRVVVSHPPQHPRAIAVHPEISAERFPTHPHLFRGSPRSGLPEFVTCEPDALCVYRPGDGEWSWHSGDLVLFLDFVAIYLAKHVVWVRTGADRGGIWIGPQASHQPEDLLDELDAFGECRCGRGNQYASCCRPIDLARAELNRVGAAFLAGLRAQRQLLVA